MEENMATTIITWNWDEAFDKFGFDDGDGPIKTGVVARVLKEAGYTIAITTFGLHNDIITSIISIDGAELIPSATKLGYDDPRDYLPDAIVRLLDTDPRTGKSKEMRS
jgi:hypothetical protein